MKLNSLILNFFLLKKIIKKFKKMNRKKKINSYWKFKRKFLNMIKKVKEAIRYFKKTEEEVRQVIYLSVFENV